MKLFSRRAAPQVFRPPRVRAHRGFVYLDDDIVINSLSAMEAGKVDEVVEKINLARETGLSVGLKLGTTGAEASGTAGGKATESLQADVIRRRTRFSVFEIWLDVMVRKDALGRFSGWGDGALEGVEAGQTIEIRGSLELVPLQTVFRLFLWYVDEVRKKNPIFIDSAVKPDLNALGHSEKIVKFMLGDRDQANALLIPAGEEGPEVGLAFLNEWTIEPIGRWSGTYTLIAQVEKVLAVDDEWQTLRLTEDVPLTPLEKTALVDAVEPFKDSMKTFGVEIRTDETRITGPALVLRPIAVYR